MRTFREIGETLTDKVSHHRYDRFYPMFLEGMRNREFNMLEIGIDKGGSMMLWKEYFPKANIFGADINSEWSDERCVIRKCDQSNLDSLKELVSNTPKCQLIVDDGSHQPYHQFITFIELFHNLLDYGGIYIVEDIECNFWSPERKIYGYKAGKFSFFNFLKSIPEQINGEFSGRQNLFNASSITFAHNCVIVVKKTEEEIAFTNREYRFKECLSY